jgi:hypothetical protein
MGVLMRHLKPLGIALVALFTYGVMVTSASASTTLPDISLASGTSYPLHMEVTYLTSANVENTGTEGLESKEANGGSILLLLLLDELSGLGTFSVLFTKVHIITEAKEGAECNSEGDKSGEVLGGGTFHVVFLPPASSKKRGDLFLERELKIECAKVKIKVKGSVLSSLEQPSGTEQTTLSFGVLHGSKGTPELTKYFTDTSEGEAKLESNFGSGFLAIDVNVAKGGDLHTLEGKSFSVTPAEL